MKFRTTESAHYVVYLYIEGILKEVGVIKRSKVVEVQRPDLVGRYLGETAVQTKSCITRAQDGVLFVDEAYRLKVDSEKDYGKEALETLMEAMLLGNPVMIFAGYPTQMEEFMKLNPGFKRRIRSIFHLEDYTCEELAEIFERKLHFHGFTTDLTRADLKATFESMTSEKLRRDWNAGFCDRLFELAKENLDGRLVSDSFGEISEELDISKISQEDINGAIKSILQY